MTLAVRGVVELFRLVKREKELHREILAFSISHDHRTVRIYDITHLSMGTRIGSIAIRSVSLHRRSCSGANRPRHRSLTLLLRLLTFCSVALSHVLPLFPLSQSCTS
jgi:hypothetical protein